MLWTLCLHLVDHILVVHGEAAGVRRLDLNPMGPDRRSVLSTYAELARLDGNRNFLPWRSILRNKANHPGSQRLAVYRYRAFNSSSRRAIGPAATCEQS